MFLTQLCYIMLHNHNIPLENTHYIHINRLVNVDFFFFFHFSPLFLSLNWHKIQCITDHIGSSVTYLLVLHSLATRWCCDQMKPREMNPFVNHLTEKLQYFMRLHSAITKGKSRLQVSRA